VPLPLVSFGGTSLVVSLAAMGVLLNIAKQGEDGPTPRHRRAGPARRDRRSNAGPARRDRRSNAGPARRDRRSNAGPAPAR
jgi:cell division protein FtsW